VKIDKGRNVEVSCSPFGRRGVYK